MGPVMGGRDGNGVMWDYKTKNGGDGDAFSWSN
jgi:hypothetical protein